MRAYPQGSTQKRATLDRLSEVSAAGLFPKSDDEGSIGLLECLAGDNEARAVERTVGIPGSLALLAQESVDMLARNPDAARELAREWVDAPSPGSDLTAVPGTVALWLLDQAAASNVSRADGPLPSSYHTVRDLHARALAGEAIERATWSAARNQAIAETDEDTSTTPDFIGRLAETLAWPALSSRTVLIEGTRIVAELHAMAAQQGSATSSSEDDEIRRTMDALFEETAADREADPDQYNFPDVFAARHPAMSKRFLEKLEAGETAFSDAFASCTRHSASLMRAAPVA